MTKKVGKDRSHSERKAAARREALSSEEMRRQLRALGRAQLLADEQEPRTSGGSDESGYELFHSLADKFGWKLPAEPAPADALARAGATRAAIFDAMLFDTRLLEDPDLMRYVRDHRVPLEMCLSSNIQTRAVRTLREHPCGDYFRQGLRVTLNTDNRLMSATTASEEIALAARAFRFSPYEVKRIILNGFKSGFMPYPQKARMLREVNLEIDRVFMDAFPSEYDLRGSY